MPSITLSNGTRFEAAPGTSMLDAALACGVVLEHSCRTGRCGRCKARATRGTTQALRAPISLPDAEADRGWVLTCTHGATSDVHLDIADLGPQAHVEARISPARIDALERLADDVLRVRLRLPPRTPFRFLAGQSLEVIAPSGVRRSYSIASASADPQMLELQIRRVDGGVLSAWWFEHARPNDLLRFHGPRGTFFLRPVSGRDVVFLATGTGIAPICSMLMQIAAAPAGERPRSVTLYWGGRRREDLYLDPRPMLAGLRHVPVLSRGDIDWHGARGHVQDVLLHECAHGAAPALAGACVYACGSEAMIHGARGLLAGAGLPEGQFHFDAFVSSD
jgi:CDP-4-dehydro-6-deoxyglucose reductase